MKTMIVAVIVSLQGLQALSAQTTSEKHATLAFLGTLQTATGGFQPAKTSPNGKSVEPSLRATVAALRAAKYFGGDIPNRQAAIQFVEKCFDKSTRGFVDSLHGSGPDSILTAVGLMALVELKIPVDDYAPAAIKYLDEHARSFEEIRMAAAGLEAIHKRSTRANGWLQQIAKMRNADGTYGQGRAVSRDTAGCAMTILRLGGKLENRDRVVKALKEGQRKDGGFGKAENEDSDLETCYRVTRTLVMLKEKPAKVATLRGFINRCRNRDAGYGNAPGKPSGAASTYFAAIILHWLEDK